MFSRFAPKTKTLILLKPNVSSTPRFHQAIHPQQPRPFSILAKKMSTNLLAKEHSASNSSFPHSRLRKIRRDASKTPVVLVACGSYSPITILHLQMFEMASDFIKFNTNFEVMGGFLSPVSDAYKKQGLAKSTHRIIMCELAVQERKDGWLEVDPWEALQVEYTPTAQVLDHFNHEINEVLGGAQKPDGSRVPMRIMLLAGADLIQTMSIPGLWSDEDLEHILGKYGGFVVTRQGTDIDGALESLEKWRDNIYVFEPPGLNDVSSTKIRLLVKRGHSIKYLTPDPVVDYIEKHGLYQQEKVPPTEIEEG